MTGHHISSAVRPARRAAEMRSTPSRTESVTTAGQCTKRSEPVEQDESDERSRHEPKGVDDHAAGRR